MGIDRDIARRSLQRIRVAAKPNLTLEELARDIDRMTETVFGFLGDVRRALAREPAGDRWEPLGITVADSAVTTLEIDGEFDGNTDGEYRFDVDLILVTGTAKTIDLVPAGVDSADLDSVYQQTSIITVANAWRLASMDDETRLWGRANIEPKARTAGHMFRWHGGIAWPGGGVSHISQAFGSSDDNESNITGWSITSSVASKIGAGSTVRAYRRRIRE